MCLVLVALPVAAQDAEAEAETEAEGEADGDAAPAPDERARAYFVLGRSAYDAGNYEEAITQFERAYELSQRSDLLFNLYQGHHRAGNLAPAVDYLERYLEEGSPDDLQRGTLTERLTNLRQQLEQQQAQEAREAEEAERRRQEELEQTRAAAQSHSMRNAGIAVLSIGVAAGAMFGVFAGLAAKEDGDLEDTCSPVCSGDEVSKLRSFNRGADVSLGLAGVGIVTGVVLLLVAPSSDGGSDERARVQPLLGPTTAGLGLEGRF